MNFVIHPRIREALKRSETVNVRGEVSIPLCRLQSELHRLHIPQQDFKDYLYECSRHVFFSSGARNLQNSSIVQKIFIKFAGVIGVGILCNCSIITCKVAKNISLLQFF